MHEEDVRIMISQERETEKKKNVEFPTGFELITSQALNSYRSQYFPTITVSTVTTFIGSVACCFTV